MSVQDEAAKDPLLEYARLIIQRERAKAGGNPGEIESAEHQVRRFAAEHTELTEPDVPKLGLVAAIQLLQKMEKVESQVTTLVARLTPAIAAVPPPPSTKFTDIIVAVHGIGQQIRYSTARYVATRVAGSNAMLGDSRSRPVVPLPLGYFHSEVKSITSVVVLDDALEPPMSGVGFAEVFWADIPQGVQKEGSTLEETKAWGRTVVARAQALWARKRPGVPPDFSLAAEVLDEVIETVYVLENLLFLADKAGLFKFDLREVLEAYLGDVQIVAEFANYRNDIVLRFHQAMEQIYEEQCRNNNGEVRLHIVAHSEGTVVSFLGLLQAMSGMQCKTSGPQATPTIKLERTGAVPAWLKSVGGYMTIGSPIDKHLLLWERMWANLTPNTADTQLKGRIKWRNYYDYGDPIGFKLDTAREWLRDRWKTKVFDFTDKDDIGFARYLLPGKAHNDYWNDADVFEHFVEDVGIAPKGKDAPPAKRPATKWPIYFLSPTIPYVLSFCLLFLGVYLLDKAVLSFMYPFDDPEAKYLLISQLGVDPTPAVDRVQVFFNSLGIAALIAGTTLFARFPRLAVGRRWFGVGFLSFAVGCWIYSRAVSGASQKEIGGVFQHYGVDPTLGTCGLALVVGIIGVWVARRSRRPDEDRRERWLLRGMRPLIVCGAIAVGVIVASQLFPGTFGLQEKLTPAQAVLLKNDQDRIKLVQKAGFDREELRQLFAEGNRPNLDNLDKVKPFLTARPPVWPVLLAAAFFLYLWWLATLVFDLSFVWQRYVRGSVAHDRLKEWAAAGEPKTAPGSEARTG